MYLLKERGRLGNYVLVTCASSRGRGRSLQGARDLGRGGARHRGRVGVGDVLGRLVGGVVLERRGLLLGRGRRRRLRLQGLVGVLRLRHRSGKRRRVADFDLGRRPRGVVGSRGLGGRGGGVIGGGGLGGRGGVVTTSRTSRTS